MVMGDMVMKVDVVVIGSGPAGYSAAFRAAELGLDVTLVDPRPQPGGSYLYDTCIPSKSYLAQVQLLIEAQKAQAMGIYFQNPEIDLKQMNSWKDKIQCEITDNLLNLCAKHGVQLLQGKAFFESSKTIRLKDSELSKLKYKYAVIATGALPVMFHGSPFDQSDRVMSPVNALNINKIPEKMLVVGGGCAGVEIGSIYSTLGSTVDLAEQNSHILANTDEDLTAPLTHQLSSQFKHLLLQTTVTDIIVNNESVTVEMHTPGGKESHSYGSVVIAIGHTAHSNELGLENTLIEVDNNGAIKTDFQQRTAEPNIFAVGDVTNHKNLAHTAIRQGQVAAEVIAGQSSSFDIRAIPNIIYTSPQIAWCGLSESDALKQNIPIIIKKYPWKYSTRAITLGLTDGLTKIISSKEDSRILGAGITGTGAEDLISEWVLAIEMGALVEDIELCLHGHPTLSEVL
ncbi:MAG: dihydrolipoamide dehydrogenase [Desulforhopalus sp.]|jgi:dihydrolipoamide dehydrogenase